VTAESVCVSTVSAVSVPAAMSRWSVKIACGAGLML